MPRPGFIHGKLDIKMLTLYILSHVAAPIDFATLTDLVMCDSALRDHNSLALPSVIRRRCDLRLAPLNAALKRKAQVRSELIPGHDGSFTVRLTLDDDQGSLFTLSLLAASEKDGKAITRRFTDHPDRIYNGILGVLLADEAAETEGEQ